MPEPVRRGQRYMPGLDGLRAVAVLAVIGYHVGVGWTPGGLLGVGVFFTLSGYLITDLLLGQYDCDGRLRLADFWRRRARRLLPALFVMLAVVLAWVTLLDRSRLPDLRGDVAAAAVYISNWWQITQHVSYFARFGPSPPLDHLWSLAVEEQFYLVWPGLLLLGLRYTRRRSGLAGVRPLLGGLTLALAGMSAVWMAVLYHPGFDTTRVYDGTDTRAFGLLFGAALAMVWPSRHLRADVTPRARQLLDTAGAAGVFVVVLMIWQTTQYSAFLYRGGMVLLSLATALVVAVVAHPASWLARVLGMRPVRWIGARSYGIYLWHFPVIALTTSNVYGTLNLRRSILQVAVAIGLAALSWRYVEAPIRRGGLRSLWQDRSTQVWRMGAARRLRWAGVTAAALVFTTACVGMSGVTGGSSRGSSALLTETRLDTSTAPTQPTSPGSKSRSQPSSTASRSGSAAAPTGAAPAGGSCRAVVHIGDSTSEGMISPDYLPDPVQRLDAQYRRVGITTQHLEISGARSIVETLNPSQANAYEVAQQQVHSGYRGCWVLALGTNDTADVFVGSNVDRKTRVERMMSEVGSSPVLWINVKSLLASGPYSNGNMKLWDSALMQACARYPNMRVFDWAAMVRDAWFISDGIHFTSEGNAARAKAIADALTRAFPAAGGATPGCLVQ